MLKWSFVGGYLANIFIYLFFYKTVKLILPLTLTA